ncbi:hypothetical protein BGX21_000522 [Mortierella sp. AD011]|nr:hypothetical protein BGX21_000522 [Mortierella sp. AD011]
MMTDYESGIDCGGYSKDEKFKWPVPWVPPASQPIKSTSKSISIKAEDPSTESRIGLQSPMTVQPDGAPSELPYPLLVVMH